MQEIFALEACQMKLCKVIGKISNSITVLTETLVHAVNIIFYGY